LEVRIAELNVVLRFLRTLNDVGARVAKLIDSVTSQLVVKLIHAKNDGALKNEWCHWDNQTLQEVLHGLGEKVRGHLLLQKLKKAVHQVCRLVQLVEIHVALAHQHVLLQQLVHVVEQDFLDAAPQFFHNAIWRIIDRQIRNLVEELVDRNYGLVSSVDGVSRQRSRQIDKEVDEVSKVGLQVLNILHLVVAHFGAAVDKILNRVQHD
jgi:hypothetical protein